MAASWNKNPSAFQPKVTPTLPTKQAATNVIRLAFITIISFLASRYSFILSFLLPARFLLAIDLLLWSTSGLSGVRAVSTAYQWYSTRDLGKQQQQLAGQQRVLMGLPPVAPKTDTPAVASRKVPSAAPTPSNNPISPPLRYSRTPPPGFTQPDTGYWPASAGVGAAGRMTPLSGHGTAVAIATPNSTGISRPSPRSAFGPSSAVATPQQLQSYLDNLEAASTGKKGAAGLQQAYGQQQGGGGYGTAAGTPLGGTPGGGSLFGGAPGGGTPFSATPAPSVGGFATPTPLRSASFTLSPMDTVDGADISGGSLNFLTAEQADVLSSPALPYGLEPPKYRSSWLPRAKANQSVTTSQDVLEASTDTEAADFMWAVLKIRAEWLEVWTERLREWFSSRVLKPLVNLVRTAHTLPNAVMSKHGQSVQLPPLASVFATMSGAGRTQAGGAGDVEAQLRQAQQLAAYMAQPNLANPGLAADAKQLSEGLRRYEQLLLLLLGKRPSNLLPPAPPGYVWARVQQLAEGTCMPEYNWNGGGAWAGRLWTKDLPTDSLLLAYMFAAFIDAPGWEFAASAYNASATSDKQEPTLGGAGQAGAGAGGASTPLFLGTIRSTRPPPQYSAILAYRPEKPGRGVDAVLALNQSGGPGAAGGLLSVTGGSTMFCFLAEGRLLVLSGSNALFHVLLAFLTFHKTKYNNALGGHYLQDAALELAAVIEPPKPGAGVVQAHSVFGWWFPARPRALPHDKFD